VDAVTYGAARPGDVASGLRGPGGPPGWHPSVADDKVVHALKTSHRLCSRARPELKGEYHASQQQDRAHHGGAHLVALSDIGAGGTVGTESEPVQLIAA
jgi:hypothetical protein